MPNKTKKTAAKKTSETKKTSVTKKTKTLKTAQESAPAETTTKACCGRLPSSL